MKTAALLNTCSISIDQAIRVTTESMGGTIVAAKLKAKKGRVVWSLKLLTPQGSIKVYVDGNSGDMVMPKTERLPSVSDCMGVQDVATDYGHDAKTALMQPF